jgi:hypothetical protein
MVGLFVIRKQDLEIFLRGWEKKVGDGIDGVLFCRGRPQWGTLSQGIEKCGWGKSRSGVCGGLELELGASRFNVTVQFAVTVARGRERRRRLTFF